MEDVPGYYVVSPDRLQFTLANSSSNSRPYATE